MRLFNFYRTGVLLTAVENIEKKIFSSSCYLYFDTHNSNLLKEYKKFEVTIISTALIAIFFEMDITNSKEREKLRTIYLGKTAGFQRLILSKELKVHTLDVSNKENNKQQVMLNLKIGAKFEEYYSEIKKSIKNESIYYFLEYDKPERKWDSVNNTYTDEIIKGYDRLYQYLWNLFLCYENIDFEIFEYEQKCIDYKIYLDLEHGDLLIMNDFIKEMKEFKC